MKIQLTDAETATFKRAINGRGGFQTLLRRVQKKIDGNNVLDVSDQDTEKIIRYFFQYGQGGFQDRTKPVVKRSK